MAWSKPGDLCGVVEPPEINGCVERYVCILHVCRNKGIVGRTLVND